jgi:hypothetical protein
MAAEQPDTEFDSVASFAEWLGVGPAPVYRAVRKRVIRSIRLCGSIRIPKSERERLLRAGDLENPLARRFTLDDLIQLLSRQAEFRSLTVDEMLRRIADEVDCMHEPAIHEPAIQRHEMEVSA